MKCTACKLEKTEDQFGKNKFGKNGLRSKCRTCVATVGKLYTKTGRYRAIDERRRITEKRQKQLRSYLLKKFGLNDTSYNELYENQGGRCAICYTHRDKLSRNLCVDHDHALGYVRGLLCIQCNAGLGNFKDNANLLKNAVRYLK